MKPTKGTHRLVLRTVKIRLLVQLSSRTGALIPSIASSISYNSVLCSRISTMSTNRRHSFEPPEKLQVFTPYGPYTPSILSTHVLDAWHQTNILFYSTIHPTVLFSADETQWDQRLLECSRYQSHGSTGKSVCLYCVLCRMLIVYLAQRLPAFLMP